MFLKKHFLFIVLSCLSLVTIAQQKPASYQSMWNKVDSLITKKGLTQSALAEVNKIYAKAKKENNDAQVIKALLYRMNLQEQKTEDAEIKNIAALENEIASSKEPAKSILLSIHAEQYWQYLQQNRWKFYNRTNTSTSSVPSFKKDDIATWSIEDFHKKISELYLASIRNKNTLQQTKLEPYDAIIIKGNVRHLRPTLYDLLAHRALDYFKNDERNITKPAYAFEIRDEAAFENAASFARFNFTTRDSLSLHFRALKLFQELISFHLNDAKPDALIDVDIERIQFANSYGVMANKEMLYKKALENLTKKYESNPASAQAWYLLAEYYANKAREYSPLGDTTNRYAFITAKEICEKVIAQNQTSSKTQNEGAINCYNLLKEILQKELRLQTEKVNVPGMPFRLLVSYRNFTQLHFRLIKIDKKTKDNLGNDTWQDDYWKELLQLQASKTFSQTLPDTKDHQNHAVEIKMDALPVGEYALLSSTDKQFALTNNPLAVQFFYVSNIAYINNNNDYFVLHRQTGQPLANAKVQVWLNQYDYNTRRNTNQKAELLTTDKNGYVKIPAAKNGRGNAAIRLEVFYKDDYLFLDDQTYSYYRAEPNEQHEKETRTSFLFTDRSIYRPGQTVYFKGIVVNRNNKTKESGVADNFKTTIVLYDVNNQKLDSIKLTTNEFGSYSGKFTLPGNVLNGAFRIQDEMTRSDEQISVEEYKRPKFYTEIQKPSGTYKLNDEIQVTGTAKAYAGNNIDGAHVKYRVVRKIRFPLWRDYGYRGRIWPPYSREEMEITNGTTTTNANGEFTVRFKAIPDEKISKKDQPIFYYEVNADVTDINGETRSGNTSVAVSYQALQLNIDLPEKIHTDSLKNIKVSTTNLNDIFEKATVTVTIHKLQTPNRIFRARYWQQPDQFIMSREEYYQHFPYDIYKDENEPSKWPKLEQVTAKTDTTSKSSQFTIHHSPFTSGWYVIEAITKDKNGEEVKAIRYVQLFNKNIISPLAYGSIETSQETIEPGEKANYQLSTNLDSVFIIHDIARAEKDPERKFILLNKESKSFEIPVAETDRGGIGMNMAFIKHNRVYTDNLNLNIPFTNKQLTISYQTYRDKTLPGSEEKWKVKISGYKGDKLAAEMLTAMYDASLDQFKPHNWRTPALWNKNISAGNWNGNINFSAVQSLEKYNTDDQIKYFDKRYDRLTTLKGEYDRPMLRMSRGKDLTGPPMAAPSDGRLQSSVSDAMEGKAAGVQVESNQAMNEVVVKAATKKESTIDNAAIQIRKNFNETAFFFPDLKTDTAGNIEFSFSMPEALTQWTWMTLAHTKELAFGYSEKNIVTQKQLMVQPNAPRFLREGDRMDFSGKIVNLSDKELTGQVELQLIDATTNQSVDGWFKNVIPNQYFTVAAGQSVPVSFSIEIPYQYDKPVIYRIVASTKAGADGALSDGEENMLPVVSNRMLVTESLPLNMRGVSTKQFRFEKLLNATTGNESTLNHHAITVEYTSNPAWYAVQTLPYLKENLYECADQMFNRYYANALASKIANSSPRIKEIFETWKTIDTAALLSNLQKNEELKSVLLQETPWVLEAKTEAEQKRNIALLFDMVKMGSELESSLSKLQEMQSPNGGFVWFKGGPDDRYMTQYILTGIGHLKKLNAIPPTANNKLQSIIKAGLSYLDKRIKEDYDNLIKYKTNLANNNLGYYQIQYLYMRSFFNEHSVPGETFKAYNYYRKQSQQFWLQQNKYMQGMIALSLHRTGDGQTAKNITASLKQNAIVHEELGMYWKEMIGGYYWHQAPVESQALLIETFAEVTNDTRAVDDMKTWLLKQKQTQNWRTTKATADACYALLLQGTDWLTNTPNVKIQLGNTVIESSQGATTSPSTGGGRGEAEAGTGYIKKTIEGKNVKPEMGNITVTVSQNSPSTGEGRGAATSSWGAVYWQYFENLDKITTAATPLSLTKKLFVEKNTDRGPVLQPVADNAILKVGDKIKVRIELRVDRNMEYVHMKDMRAAAMEPVNVISQYKWQGGLGYYESTKDASTHFFFNWLPKGTYVFEYPLFVTHTGTFSNGVTTIQCMYAPEFTSHSEGVKVNVE